MTVGVLALQGCVDAHISILTQLGFKSTNVREASDFKKIDRIILPGGESTTMLKLLARNNMEITFLDFAKSNPVWGICAGAILIAKKVTHPEQRSFGLIDLHAIRNFYGSQFDSFKAELEIPKLKIKHSVDFIRAPKLEAMSDKVSILASYKETPVLFQQGNILASSFHIELGIETGLHAYFARLK